MLMKLKQKKKQITCGAVNFFPSSGAVMYANEFETKKTTNIEIKWNKKITAKDTLTFTGIVLFFTQKAELLRLS